MTMPGPVVSGVRQSGSIEQRLQTSEPSGDYIPLMAEGSIHLLLLNSGDVLMARLRNTTDRDGDPAYQLIRPCKVCYTDSCESAAVAHWKLEPYLAGLTPQRNVVLFKSALASVLEPDPILMQTYTEQTAQECPLEETPVERLKRAFQEFTESFEAENSSR
tara:strand:+ start:41 stop:523 length:483 start_codon:yes stop_codon:yes gene_type:complete